MTKRRQHGIPWLCCARGATCSRARPRLAASDSLVVLCERGCVRCGARLGRSALFASSPAHPVNPATQLGPPWGLAQGLDTRRVSCTQALRCRLTWVARLSHCAAQAAWLEGRHCCASAPQNSVPEQLRGKPLVSSSAPSMLLGGCHGGLPACVLLRMKPSTGHRSSFSCQIPTSQLGCLDFPSESHLTSLLNGVVAAGHHK